MTSDLVSNIDPLQPEYIPAVFINRDNTQTALENLIENNSGRNIHLQGPRGSGKTHLLYSILNQAATEADICYIDCKTSDTEYKVLKQIFSSISRADMNDGHHTSTLQRNIEERLKTSKLVLLLDNIDFLLLNDGEDLLYFLSRMEHASQINLITVSSRIKHLREQVEERTYSSLQPYPFHLEQYSGEEKFSILFERAQDALKPQTLQRQALALLASETENLRFGLQWLKTAAIEADQVVTETVVKDVKRQASIAYANQLLDPFSDHHKLLYQAVRKLDNEQIDTIQTGQVYERYDDLCKASGKEPLSHRRLSSFVKHLELLDLITADYHYGGNKGKTRDISLEQP